MDIANILGASEVRSQRLSVYVPSRDRDGSEIDQAYWVEEALILLCDMFGGATGMPPADGAWLNKDARSLVIEKAVIVYSFIEPDAFEARIGEFAEFVRHMGEQTNQGQVAVEFDGALYLIDIQEPT